MLSARGRVRAGVLAGRGTWNCSHSTGQRDFKEKGRGMSSGCSNPALQSLPGVPWLQALSEGGKGTLYSTNSRHPSGCSGRKPQPSQTQPVSPIPLPSAAYATGPTAELRQKARGLGRLGPWCQRELFLQSEGVSKYYPLPSLPMSLWAKLTAMARASQEHSVKASAQGPKAFKKAK